MEGLAIPSPHFCNSNMERVATEPQTQVTPPPGLKPGHQSIGGFEPSMNSLKQSLELYLAQTVWYVVSTQ